MSSTLCQAPAKKAPPIFIFDEFAYYHGVDHLATHAFKNAGMACYTYFVHDDRQSVFVFDKLKSIVQSKLHDCPDLDVQANLDLYIKEASVPAREAIEVWNVVPRPYEVIASLDGGWQIKHAQFNAILPVTYYDKQLLDQALEILLLGGVIESDEPHELIASTGSVEKTHAVMSYKNQRMLVLTNFNTAELPYRPETTAAQPASQGQYLSYNCAYDASFNALSESDFNELRDLATSWRHELGYMTRFATDRVEQVWSLMPGISELNSFNEKGNAHTELSANETARLATLRTWYPELAQICDKALIQLHHDHDEAMSGVSEDHDERRTFAFYLLGRLVHIELASLDKLTAGRIVAFHMMHGVPLPHAVQVTSQAMNYENTISGIMSRLSCAIYFISGERDNTTLRGNEVITFADLAGMIRSAFREKNSCITVIENSPEWT